MQTHTFVTFGHQVSSSRAIANVGVVVIEVHSFLLEKLVNVLLRGTKHQAVCGALHRAKQAIQFFTLVLPTNA